MKSLQKKMVFSALMLVGLYLSVMATEHIRKANPRPEPEVESAP